ncbi:UDP-glycosyltransferase 74F2 [Camellia lanceoleosa]|uniref:UDP-glycosyltransferase 74F2 n=1 Tax=Camellia lanceoleosa TaxID=1840588 RepID=A0ACC0HSD1_9ERIC|nr:UDP-glycosyltransferase 74F2 [Camellia lanceoleosa]
MSIGCSVDCIVYDAFLPWGLDVAKEFGLLPLAERTKFMVLGLPPLELSDMPSFVTAPQSYPSWLEMVVNQFANVGDADWVLCNTFHELEDEVSTADPTIL